MKVNDNELETPLYKRKSSDFLSIVDSNQFVIALALCNCISARAEWIKNLRSYFAPIKEKGKLFPRLERVACRRCLVL